MSYDDSSEDAMGCSSKRFFVTVLLALMALLFPVQLKLPNHNASRAIPNKDTTPRPFAVLDPHDFRHYFSSENSFQVALRVAPFLDLPKDNYQDVLVAYYYRLQSYRKHIQKTKDDKYWVVTEFLPPVSWAGADNTISAAAGHHIMEGRWFWDATDFIEDYIQFWYIGSKNKGKVVAQPHISRYTNWIYHAALQYAMLWGFSETEPLFQKTIESAADVFQSVYIEKYLTNSSRNAKSWKQTHRVCWTQEDGFDAMEVSVSGGGCRPTISSALWGEAMALVNTAKLLGNDKIEKEFQPWVDFSRDVVFGQHWNPTIESFAVIPPWKRSNYAWKQIQLNPNQRKPDCILRDVRIPNQLVNVRELLAFMPWYYPSLVPSDHPLASTYARQFLWLLGDAGADGFSAPWGLRTVQRSSPCYNYSYAHGDCWNGPSWPYETSRVLTAISNLLSEHNPSTIQASGMSPEVFERLLVQYARQHTSTQAVNDTANPLGSGHVFENLHPDLGYWNNRARMYWKNDTLKDMGDDYNHSTFIDLILSAWLGIRTSTRQQEDWLVLNPLIQAGYFAADRIPYRGRVLSIVYDPTGSKYPDIPAKGLAILVDGKVIAQRPDLGRLVVHEEPGTPEDVESIKR